MRPAAQLRSVAAKSECATREGTGLCEAITSLVRTSVSGLRHLVIERQIRHCVPGPVKFKVSRRKHVTERPPQFCFGE